ncbi:hypothetical protein APHDU1_0022 [Anaplasma phagocytophilum]|nr:hypothetical protein APHDU1_1440 [Anaplasma phagocytophilum]KJZ99874.1 hypothetical protein APHDU1_0022 [Anaplasma phagocytophilum]
MTRCGVCRSSSVKSSSTQHSLLNAMEGEIGHRDQCALPSQRWFQKSYILSLEYCIMHSFPTKVQDYYLCTAICKI